MQGQMPRAIRKKGMLHRLKHKTEKEGRMRNRTSLGAGLVSGEDHLDHQSDHLEIKASKTKTQATIKPCTVSATAHSSRYTGFTESGRLSCT